MTRIEFAKVIAYVTAMTGKSLSDEAIIGYYDLLGDLPVPVLQIAAKRVCATHRWPTFPMAAELLEAAALTQHGDVARLTAADAWGIAWKAVGKIDLESHGSAERHLSPLPPLVVAAINTFSLPALVNGKEPVTVVRAQFMKIFEQLDDRDKQRALLPEALKKQIQSQRPAILPFAEKLAAALPKIDDPPAQASAG